MDLDCVIKLKNVDLVYTSSESLSFKKVINKVIGKKDSNILRRYKALNNVSLNIERGKVYGVIGNNGAGKSTLLRVLSGVMSPNSGIVERNYNSINLLALGIGFTKELTGLDNVYLNGMLLGFSKKQISSVLDDIIEYSELGDYIKRPMKTYSSGMVSRLGFAIAIHLKPEVLLIDEVLSVGDENFRKKSFESIKKIIKDENVTVVIVSHSMNQIEELCDEVIWLDKGCIIASGDKSEVIKLYRQYNAKELTIDDIRRESVLFDNNRLIIDLANYRCNITFDEKKVVFGREVDYIKSFNVGTTEIKVTKRCLNNQDIILYFEIHEPKSLQIDLKTDNIEGKYNYDYMYKKPNYDIRYGENKIARAFNYFNLVKGSFVLSNVYFYKKLKKTYSDGGSSNLYELIKESSDFEVGESLIRISINDEQPEASFFLILSREKLFGEISNLESYMKYYFDSIFNNSVWCSYFMQPSGTYTKLPYSVEPFTKDGYGFNLHHSSRKDLIPYYLQMKERFFADIMENAIYQAYIYQDQKNGVFFSSYTSTWLKKNSGITAPYIDTRLNETFILMIQDFQKEVPGFEKLDPMKNYLDFLYEYYKSGEEVYHLGGGLFFPDYFKYGGKLTHASLNHQLGTAIMFLNAYIKYKNDNYLEVFKLIVKFIELSADRWINPENGDLFYGVKMGQNGELIFYDKDYVYVTLLDLLIISHTLGTNFNNLYFPAINYLICMKINYLKTTEYDIFNPDSKFAPGERIDSRKKALSLYNDVLKLYPDDFKCIQPNNQNK